MGDLAAPKQRGPGRPFAKGQSGNPISPPRGLRNRLTVLAEQLMADDAEAVVRSVIRAAKDGDMTAARLVLDRIAPAPRGRLIEVGISSIASAADVLAALGALVAAVAAGRITPDEASAVAGIIETTRKAIETHDLAARIQALEEEAENERPY